MEKGHSLKCSNYAKMQYAAYNAEKNDTLSEKIEPKIRKL